MARPEPGTRLAVPFGTRILTGLVAPGEAAPAPVGDDRAGGPFPARREAVPAGVLRRPPPQGIGLLLRPAGRAPPRGRPGPPPRPRAGVVCPDEQVGRSRASGRQVRGSPGGPRGDRASHAARALRTARKPRSREGAPRAPGRGPRQDPFRGDEGGPAAAHEELGRARGRRRPASRAQAEAEECPRPPGRARPAGLGHRASRRRGDSRGPGGPREGRSRRGRRGGALGGRLRSRPSLPGRPSRSSRPPRSETAVEAIRAALARGVEARFLLDGVTGSGKTEVYLAALEASIALGRQGILLVPGDRPRAGAHPARRRPLREARRAPPQRSLRRRTGGRLGADPPWRGGRGRRPAFGRLRAPSAPRPDRRRRSARRLVQAGRSPPLRRADGRARSCPRRVGGPSPRFGDALHGAGAVRPRRRARPTRPAGSPDGARPGRGRGRRPARRAGPPRRPRPGPLRLADDRAAAGGVRQGGAGHRPPEPPRLLAVAPLPGLRTRLPLRFVLRRQDVPSPRASGSSVTTAATSSRARGPARPAARRS